MTKDPKIAESTRRKRTKPAPPHKKAASQPKPKGKAKPVPKPVGRPSIYSEALAERICARIASGDSVRKICREDDMPCQQTFFKWALTIPDFIEQYRAALEMKADLMRDDLLEIADDGSQDTYIDPASGQERTNAEVVARSRLRVDTRKWLMARQSPRKYGDKLDLNHGVQPDNPLAKLLENLGGNVIGKANGRG